MKMKRMLVVLCALCMLFSTAYAHPSRVTGFEKNLIVEMKLKNTETGEEVVVPGVIMPEISPFSLDDNDEQSMAVVFESLLPSDRTTTTTEWDDSGSVKAYLKIYYKLKDTTPGEYLLTRVSGNYSISDSQVRVSSSTLSYICNGRFPENVTNQIVENYPLSESSFSYYTNFTKYVTPYLGMIGSDYVLNLERGSSNKWELRAQIMFRDSF